MSVAQAEKKNIFGTGVWPWDYYGVSASITDRAKEAYKTLVEFVEHDCIPAEKVYAAQLGIGEKRFAVVPPVIDELKAKAKSLGLWNMFMTVDYSREYGVPGPGFTTLEYAIMCEVLGQSSLAPEATNCAAPDTGNMHVIARFGNAEQRQKWLVPLMNGDIRSAFAMTEPAVASSDATNICASVKKDGDYYVINGRKWWTSGFPDPRCKIMVFVGQTNPDSNDKYSRQTVLLVEKDLPGVKLVRNLTVLGYDDAPHGHSEVLFENVRVHKSNLVAGEGRGFEVLQGRLGPGRIHYGMRALGRAERVFDRMLVEATKTDRRPFGKIKAEYGGTQTMIAEARMNITAARGLVLQAADAIDKKGPKGAQREIGMVKVFVPRVVQEIVDQAIQLAGGGGVSQEYELAYAFHTTRAERLGDGPDAVHLWQLARRELARAAEVTEKVTKRKEREVAMLNKYRL
ncbi:dehydrogenase-like protein [Hyaloraphidium curvatum]|nr:dehydrogenase-like protein [Hyaloraphidium curvatum]